MRHLPSLTRARSIGALLFGKAKWGVGFILGLSGVLGTLLGVPEINQQLRTTLPLVRCWFPVPMDATRFTVVMTPLVAVEADGRVHATADSRALADLLYTRLEADFAALDLPVPVEVRGPDDACAVNGPDPAARAAAAEAMAQSINADLVIYGVIQTVAQTGSAQFQPEFYVGYSSFTEAADLIGPHELGRPLLVNVPIRLEELKAVADHPINVRAKVVSLVTLGLAAFAVDDFDAALRYFGAAEELPGWSAGASKEVIYLLLGNAASNRAAVTLNAEDVLVAIDYYEQALEIAPDFARALVGLAGATYQRALGNLQTRQGSQVSQDWLDEAEILYETALETPAPPAAEIPLKVHFGLGQLYLVRHYLMGETWLDRARAEFQAVIDLHSAAPARNADLVGHAYARLGLIAAQLDGDPAAAVPLYTAALDQVSPRWQAFYYLDLGDLARDQADTATARDHYQRALSIAELHGNADMTARAEARLAALGE